MKPDTKHSKEWYTCYFDGACEPRNPGGAMGMGAVIFDDYFELYTFSGFAPMHRNNSNNLAEYKALEWLLDIINTEELNEKPIRIYGDSMLVIRQMCGWWKIKQGRYVKTALRCKKKLAELTKAKIDFFWIPREQNEIADEYSKAQLIKNNIPFRIQPI